MRGERSGSSERNPAGFIKDEVRRQIPHLRSLGTGHADSWRRRPSGVVEALVCRQDKVRSTGNETGM